jgi:hypothetical protein
LVFYECIFLWCASRYEIDVEYTSYSCDRDSEDDTEDTTE